MSHATGNSQRTRDYRATSTTESFVVKRFSYRLFQEQASRQAGTAMNQRSIAKAGLSASLGRPMRMSDRGAVRLAPPPSPGTTTQQLTRRQHFGPETLTIHSDWLCPLLCLIESPRLSASTPPHRGLAPPEPPTARPGPLIHMNHAVSPISPQSDRCMEPIRNSDDVVQGLACFQILDAGTKEVGFKRETEWTAGWLTARQPCRSSSLCISLLPKWHC
jgi:hypothetical protein